jgi:hypothetical protein
MEDVRLVLFGVLIDLALSHLTKGVIVVYLEIDTVQDDLVLVLACGIVRHSVLAISDCLFSYVLGFLDITNIEENSSIS